MPPLSKIELCQLLPHGETMCLLDAVESWDSSGIACLALSHRDEQNPLRNKDRLHAICGLEYAAQAMAVHVGLTSSHQNIRSAIGYLGSVRELKMGTSRLDTYLGPLRIYGELLFSHGYNFMYYFKIEFDKMELLTGRASIFLQPGTQPS